MDPSAEGRIIDIATEPPVLARLAGGRNACEQGRAGMKRRTRCCPLYCIDLFIASYRCIRKKLPKSTENGFRAADRHDELDHRSFVGPRLPRTEGEAPNKVRRTMVHRNAEVWQAVGYEMLLH
jgi:hypothetical protein